MNIHAGAIAMHIRHAGQLEHLTPADYIRWRSGVFPEIALELAQKFTAEELCWVIDGRYAKHVIRSGYKFHGHKIYEDGEQASLQDRVFDEMADHLRCRFLQVERVHRDRDCEEIFETARRYCGKFPNHIE